MNCENIPIEGLVLGQLEKDEARQVINHVEKCTTCRERLEIMALLLAENKRVLMPRPARLSRILAIAASLFLAIAGLSYVIWSPVLRPPDPGFSTLVTRNPYPFVPLSTRATDETPDARFTQAMAEYCAGKYSEASKQLSGLPRTPEVVFYQGVSEYLEGHFETAVSLFTNASLQASRWNGPAAWFEANARLALNEESKARVMLQAISEKEGEFARNAQELLAEMQRVP